MLEGRFASFLTDRIEAKVGTLPQSEAREEITLLVGELQGVVAAVFGTEDGTKRRSSRKTQDAPRRAGSASSSAGGERGGGGTLVQSTGANSATLGDRR